MIRYRISLKNRRRPTVVDADWYWQLGDWIHFFARRADGGGQTVLRLPASDVVGITEVERL